MTSYAEGYASFPSIEMMAQSAQVRSIDITSAIRRLAGSLLAEAADDAPAPPIAVPKRAASAATSFPSSAAIPSRARCRCRG